MYLPISSLLFLLASLAILVGEQGTVQAGMSWILSILLLLIFVLTSVGAARKRNTQKDLFAARPLLLAYTAVFLFSTFSSTAISSLSPWFVMYNTVALIMYGVTLSLHLRPTRKNFLLLASASVVPGLASLLFFPFSGMFVLNFTLLIGVFVFASRRGGKTSSASRLSLQSMLAHEIRTPLTVMQTTGSLLLEEVPGPLNEQQKQFVRSNFEYTQRLITFSENMLMLLKFEKEFELKKIEKIHIRTITQDVVAFFAPLLQIKGQTIRYTFPALVSTPLGDESLIRQVFINLIHNAIKHTKEGGYIVISVTQDDEQVVVSITDNGTGVVGEGRENLFREFYQEKQASEEHQDGFGLGLSIARQIIQKHGGQVYITSVKDKGTMVSFTLPAKAVR